jgi:hypothetical protein
LKTKGESSVRAEKQNEGFRGYLEAVAHPKENIHGDRVKNGCGQMIHRRRRVDMRRLPLWVRYLLGSLTVVAVVGMAWIYGREEPVPPWVEHGLVPALGWIYIILVVVALWHRYAKRIKG